MGAVFMKYLPFRHIVAAILLLALLYVKWVPFCESSFARYHENRLEHLLLETDQSLFDGEVSVVPLVRANISRYVNNHTSFYLFPSRLIRVTTPSGEIVYPAPEPLTTLLETPQAVARENYRLLEGGLDLKILFYARPDGLLSVGSLSFFALFVLGWLYCVYRKQVQYIAAERHGRELTIAALKDGKRQSGEAHGVLIQRQDDLQRNLSKARCALSESNESNNDLLEEVEVLEALLEENEAQRAHLKEEMTALSRNIVSQETLPSNNARGSNRKTRERDAMAKRIKILYKSLRMHDRALKGFSGLDEGMRLKCEEVIHQLNSDPESVTVKRKVFGGKGIGTYFEVEFAYKGRLYFMRHPGGRVEVLAVGTKNSQAAELGFLGRIRGGLKSA